MKLLGLTGQDFVSRIQRGAEATPFTARRMKKRNCRLCMEGAVSCQSFTYTISYTYDLYNRLYIRTKSI